MKSDIRHGKRPYKEGNNTKQEMKKDSYKIYNRNITTTTKTTTNITPNSTQLDHNPEYFKNNHNQRCPEQQKVWILDPNQANH